MDLFVEITKGIERTHLILPCLVKFRVPFHSLYPVEPGCICATSRFWFHTYRVEVTQSDVPWLLGFLCSWQPVVCYNTAWTAGFRRLSFTVESWSQRFFPTWMILWLTSPTFNLVLFSTRLDKTSNTKASNTVFFFHNSLNRCSWRKQNITMNQYNHIVENVIFSETGCDLGTFQRLHVFSDSLELLFFVF